MFALGAVGNDDKARMLVLTARLHLSFANSSAL